MKNFSFSILFAFLFIALFASCDNEYNNLNKGNGIFYYGLDNELRGFYGFLKGEQYYFEVYDVFKHGYNYSRAATGGGAVLSERMIKEGKSK